MKKDVTRLYKQFQPSHYILDIKPDKTTMRFTGSVIISGQKTGRPSKRITLHQHGLKVTAATITHNDKNGDTSIHVERINHQKSFDEVRLHTSQMLYPGKYTIRVVFEGLITENMNGIYPCFYNNNGTKEIIIATQFESHHAREAFPCIDEPEAKATFDVTLTGPADEAILSNTTVLSSKVTGDTQTVTFNTTPHMSTYLLAFVIGKLQKKQGQTKSGVVVSAYATADNLQHTDFALSVATRCLDFYDEYFAIPYPLEKLDLIALPDFASGAMENWGCVTFREQALLVDEQNTSLPAKQYVAMVVAHELAHQWFGNLVTMRWWTDLWLNEGFASWIEYLAVHELFPEWHMWTQFIVDEQHRALKLDALEHTHPVEVAVHHPEEIRTIFDTISYSKGASVIHMLHEYLGAQEFRDGLRHYLDRHKYANTDTIDLWQALEEIADKPVKDFMHAWTSQPGFPIVRATIEADSLTLNQTRFFINPESPQNGSEIWPIALLSGKDTMPDIFSEKSKQISRAAQDVKLNTGQSGFYRVAYNASHLKRLGELITRNHLSSLDRLGILDDVFETAKAGYIHTIDALNFLSVFRNEQDYAVWDVIATSLGSIKSVMDSEDLRDNMKPFVRELCNGQLQRLGWEQSPNESYFDSLLRPVIIGLMAGADDPAVIDEIQARFNAMQQPEDIDPNFRSVIYGTAARLGDRDTFNKLVSLHNGSNSSEERVTLAGAITSFRDDSIQNDALAMITDGSVRLQDVSYWVAYSFMNRFSRDKTWMWMQHNWTWLMDKLGTDLSFSRFPQYAANAFSDATFLDKYTEFFESRKTPAFDRAIKQGAETLTWHIAWRDRDLAELLSFFKKYESQKDQAV